MKAKLEEEYAFWEFEHECLQIKSEGNVKVQVIFWKPMACHLRACKCK